MPTIDVDYAEFERLLGVALHGDMAKLDEILACLLYTSDAADE